MKVAQQVEQQAAETIRSGSRLLRVPEVAEALGLGLTKTWELVNRGEIPSIQIGRCRRVRERDLEAWIDEREVDS